MLIMGKWEKDEKSVSDLDLIRRCSEGELRAQETLYKRWFSFAMSVAVRYTADEDVAMEVVNDSFMKVLDKINEFDHTRPFRSWYGRILINSAIDNYRRNAKHSSHLEISEIEATEEQEPAIEAELTAGDILLLYRKLPEHYRVTFNLFEIEGYTHAEISQKLGITESTSRSNLTRARKMLRQLYIKNFNPGRRTNEAV
jgi:RNA polymerase sigma-70 factor (ECF subfamily)